MGFLPTCLLALLLQQAGEWSPDLAVRNVEVGGNFASTMESLSDVNGDGIREVLIGAYSSNLGVFIGGAAYLCSGADGSLLQVFFGEYTSGAFGLAVSGAGDVDGDGVEDLIVGSPQAVVRSTWLGAAYVYSGSDYHLIARLEGGPISEGGWYGIAVSDLDDVNQDGYDDFAVGDSLRNFAPGTLGVAFVYSGKDGTVLYSIAPTGYLFMGHRLESVGDLDGDGIRELLVNHGSGVGLFSGRTGQWIRDHPIENAPEVYGQALASLGDLDQDGWDDYGVGAPQYEFFRSGTAYVYSGATGSLMYTLSGQADEDDFGYSLAGAGDVDGDGYPDVLVGAPQDNWGSNTVRGSAHLFSGFDGRRMHVFESNHGGVATVGRTVAGAGDRTGDGLADFWIASSGSLFDHSGNRGVVIGWSLDSYLHLSARGLSASAGGRVWLDLDFPPSEAGRPYAVLASSGAGRFRIADTWLPLDRSPLLVRSAFAPPAGFDYQHGILDFHGDARARLDLPPGAAAAWVGRTLKFCALTHDPAGGIGLHSAAMPLTIEP